MAPSASFMGNADADVGVPGTSQRPSTLPSGPVRAGGCVRGSIAFLAMARYDPVRSAGEISDDAGMAETGTGPEAKDMKCFTHPAVDAVALCKSCSRGVCSQCVVEVGKSCACRGRCEADVAAVDQMVRRVSGRMPNLKAVGFVSGAILVLLGLFGTLLGIFMVTRPGGNASGWGLIVGGVVSTLLGLVHFLPTGRAGPK
jgi:hypothetical protein